MKGDLAELRSFVIVVLVAFLLSSCTSLTSNKDNWPTDKPTTLTVLTFYEQLFNEQYAVPFSIKHSNVKFRTVLLPPNEPIDWNKVINEHQPDLLHLSNAQYLELAELGLLQDLESMTLENNWKPEDVHPAITTLLRANTDGTVYGGAATFFNQALYYNAELFRKYGISPPSNDMTWDEVLQLAEQFTLVNEDKWVYGTSMQDSTVSSQLMLMGRAEGLTMFSADGQHMLIQSDSWTSIYGKLTEALKKKAIYTLPAKEVTIESSYQQHPFMNGQAAMFVGNTNYLNLFASATQADGNPLNWGVVTLPQGNSRSGKSAEYSLLDIVSIPKDRGQMAAGKAFISYIMGEEWAAQQTLTNPHALIGRYKQVKEHPDPNRQMEPFYALEPVTYNDPSSVSPDVVSLIEQLVEDETMKVINNEQTASEALQRIQTEGDIILNSR